MRRSRVELGRLSVIAASIQFIFASNALANPTGPQVINGAATFQRPDARTLNVTNSPGTIINWQGFSVGSGELTRFIQQSPSSAVLNRVVGADISQIQGQLLSNGRVFLINPSGIVIGPGAMIDTAGFVASTLNMLDGDFLAGKLKFQGDANSGSIINQGWIRTGYGGHVLLIAPQIENSGLIHTPGGQIILAAGRSLTITSLDLEGVQFEVQAPTDSALNIGQLLADGGAVGVFAGSLKHSGEIRANALVYDEAGRIVLQGQNEVQITAGSTMSADGRIGGDITVQSHGSTRVAGSVSAQGSAGQGGEIKLLGDRVSVVENALVNASGSAGGGQILVGGDFQGGNPAIQNATNTFVGPEATLQADATQSGDGGRVIVWSNDKAQFYGSLSAQGGPEGGNGGFAEVSGKQNLIFAGSANLGAAKGNLGSLLLDPLDLFVFNGGGSDSSIIDENTDFPANAATVSPATLAGITGNVSLFASRYMRISDPITLSAPGQGLSATVGTYTAPLAPDPLALSNSVPNRLDIGANITTAGGTVSLSAPNILSVASSLISTAGGAVALNSSGAIQASQLSLEAGTGAINISPGSFLQLGSVGGGSVVANAPGFMQFFGPVTTTGGAVSLTSSTSSVSAFGGINASGGNVAISGTSVSGGTIDTTGSVDLTATSGSISATVNNAASLTAAASSTFGSSVNIGSTTTLNANAVSANCTGGFCSASVNLSSTGNINVGTVTATAAASGGFISESVTLNSSGGSIRAMSPSSQVTAADVSLITGQGSGGGIGTAASALNVDVERTFTFRPNGEFNVLLNGAGPNRLFAELGVAPNGQNYSGTLTRSGGGLTLDATANDSVVTVNNFSITTGFDQRVFNTDPTISLRVPNGSLVATAVSVPTGDMVSTILQPNGIPLQVDLSAFGNLTLGSYSRAPGGLAKTTNITSNTGTITLGTVDASKDNVTINAPQSVTVSSLITTGSVTINAGGVAAQSDSSGLEISAGGTLSITSSANIGSSGFTNPLDVAAGSVSLNSFNFGSTIGGGAMGGALVANTQNLTINASGTFNVTTGSTALKNLTVNANPALVGAGGLAQVRTEALQAGDKTYAFSSDGTDFTLNIGAVPATQFAGGAFNFTSSSGDIHLTGNTSLGTTGSLVLLANNGGIDTGGASITAGNVSLTANTTINTDTGAITASGSGGNIMLLANTSVIAGDLNAPGTISIDRRFCCFAFPAVDVGAIGNVTAPQSLTVAGSSVDTGAIMGAGNIALSATSGQLVVGGAITTTSGSTIALFSNGGGPFQFTTLDAGTTGTVNITSSPGIEQTGGSGITAGTVSLHATGGSVIRSGPAALGLTGTTKLTVDANGDININAAGTALTDLTITQRSSLDSATVTLALPVGQTVAINGSSTDFDVAASSASALNFALTNAAGGDIDLSGSGISTSGGNVALATTSGSITTTTGGIATGGGSVNLAAGGTGNITNGTLNSGGGSVTLTSNGGDIAMGTIASSGGSVLARTFAAGGDIGIDGAVSAGAGNITLQSFGGGNISGAGSLSSTSSINVFTANGAIGTPGGIPVPLAISSPAVTLTANRALSASGDEGTVLATLTGTSALTLTADRGFNVSSDTAFSSLAVTTKGTGAGTLDLTAGGGQTYTFARPATDLFGASIANTAFEIVSVNAPTLNATFTASDGILLVRGIAGGANKINVQNLTLAATGGGDVVLQGNASDPLTLTNTNQTFSASGSASADLLVRGTVALTASSAQTLSAAGNINVNADAGGGGTVTITAPTQQFTTTGGASKMEFLGGAGAGEKVVIAATTQQRVDATSSSLDSFKLKGGSGADASVTFSHSGSGIQDFQMLAGTVTVEGGSGQNAFAKIEETGANLQRLCRFVIFQGCVPVSGLQILGGSGAGAYAQVTSVGSQDVGVSGGTLVRAGTGDGAYALLQATTAQNIFGGGDLTVEGKGGAGATATARVVSGSSQTITADDVTVLGGAGANSFGQISGTSNQTLSFDTLTMTAGNATGSFVKIDSGGTQFLSGGNMTLTAGGVGETVVANAGALIEGHAQQIFGGAITLKGGSGASGSTSDALLRNISGNQVVSGSSITLSGGHQFSTTGILNLGAGTQSVTGSGGITLASDAVTPPAHADSFVLIQNSAASAQTLTATAGGIRLNNTGDGAVGVTSAGTQTVLSRFVEVLTGAGSGGSSSLTAVGDQYIRTTNQNANGESIVVAALGSGTAKIESGASQLLEVGYPSIMQGAAGSGLLSIGSANGVPAAGTSLVLATDQNVIAGSILMQGPTSGVMSKLSATNVQTISTVLGGIDLLGGTGTDSLVTIDPLVQTILVNGSVDLSGGSGINADSSIVSAGTQEILVTSGSISLTGGSGSGADAIISSIGSQSITSSGDIALTGGAGVNSDSLILSSSLQTIIAGGDIVLTGGPIAGSDAIISNIGAQQGCTLLSFICGAQQTIIAGGSIIFNAGIGNALIEGGQQSNSTGAAAFLSAAATQETLANLDELSGAFDTLAPDSEDPLFGRRAPICR